MLHTPGHKSDHNTDHKKDKKEEKKGFFASLMKRSSLLKKKKKAKFLDRKKIKQFKFGR